MLTAPSGAVGLGPPVEDVPALSLEQAETDVTKKRPAKAARIAPRVRAGKRDVKPDRRA